MSYITRDEYVKLKQFILNYKSNHKFSRAVEVTIKKKTFYSKEEK